MLIGAPNVGPSAQLPPQVGEGGPGGSTYAAGPAPTESSSGANGGGSGAESGGDGSRQDGRARFDDDATSRNRVTVDQDAPVPSEIADDRGAIVEGPESHGGAAEKAPAAPSKPMDKFSDETAAYAVKAQEQADAPDAKQRSAAADAKHQAKNLQDIVEKTERQTVEAGHQRTNVFA